MDLDFALARFDGRNAASDAYYAAGGRAGPSARWLQQVGFVEHHHNDHLVLRGTFAGHYVDTEEGHHVSEGGTVGGFAGGMVLGACLGPAGMAAGMIAGATIGSQIGQPTEIGDGADVLRRSLTPDEVAALESSLGGTPAASPGPTEEGEVASEEA